jgi:hypothetical protein
VRVRQIKHLLAPVPQAEPIHSTTAPGNQRLHLLQTSIFLEILRMKESGESAHPLGDLRSNN